MTLARRVHYSYAEYLRMEEASPVRHEYLDGEIYAMAGGTPDHAALAAAILGALTRQLPHGCRAFTSDLRVRIPATGLSTYPDAAVVCGPSRRAEDDPLAVVNPILLVEVLSPSTEAYDRGEKLRHYREISGLREILFVSSRAPELVLTRREGDLWLDSTAGPGGSLTLQSIPAVLGVDELYAGGFEDQPPPGRP